MAQVQGVPGAGVGCSWGRCEKRGTTCAIGEHGNPFCGAGLSPKNTPAPTKPYTCTKTCDHLRHRRFEGLGGRPKGDGEAVRGNPFPRRPWGQPRSGGGERMRRKAPDSSSGVNRKSQALLPGFFVAPEGLLSNKFLEDLDRIWALRPWIPDPKDPSTWK